jgi:hypothetical protein
MQTKQANQNLPSTLTEILSHAAPALLDDRVVSVGIRATWGEVVVFRNGIVKLRQDCPELEVQS